MTDDSEQNKSEAATSFKLAKAREKGSVARGMDLGFLASLSAFCLYAWISGPSARTKISTSAQHAIAAAPDLLSNPSAVISATGMVLGSAMTPLIGLALTVFVIVLAAELLQAGFIFTAAPLKPDFSKLNPAQNLKRLFSVRILVETAKNLLKIATYIAITYFTIRHAVAVTAPTLTGAAGLAEALRGDGLRLLMLFVLAAAAFAVFDQMIVRRDYAKKMRMSRREVRRETRDREGDARLKQRRKQLHGDFVKSSQSLRGIRGADVLITNPTHFAVALKYDGATMNAPTIVSQGSGAFALRLRRLAFLYGLTVVQDRPLAQALYRCELNRVIPDALYQPVANIYLRMQKDSSRTASER